MDDTRWVKIGGDNVVRWRRADLADDHWVADTLAEDDELRDELLEDPAALRRLLRIHRTEAPNRRALRRLLDQATRRPEGGAVRWILDRLTALRDRTNWSPTAHLDTDRGPPPLARFANTIARHAPPARALTRITHHREVALH
jgi:hypothetical protein